MSFWVYILRCADGSYYTGHTDDLERRVAQHQAGEIPGCYTLQRRPLTLAFSQDFPDRESALTAEQRIKRWRRAKKEALIAGDWTDPSGLAKRRTPHRSSTPISLEGSTIASTSVPHREREDGSTPVAGRNESPFRTTTRRDDNSWMKHALDLARRAEREDDEIPVGAVLVSAEGDVIGEGWNRNISDHDPSAHAEIVALRAGGRKLENHRLIGTTLYVTLEPCAMCAMALVHARVARVVFAAADPKTGAAGSVFDLLGSDRHNHRIDVLGGILSDDAGELLRGYFRRKRRKA